MAHVTEEIATQAGLWPSAVAAATTHSSLLPAEGSRVLVTGCGTSFHIGKAWAAARQAAGCGHTDALPASEVRASDHDVALCISRSGTTSEVLWAAKELAPSTRTLGITAVHDSPLAALVDQTIVLDFADERAIVQTRWATCVLAMLRAHIGHRVMALTASARDATGAALPLDPTEFTRFVFVGRGWAAALADEAALKLREGAGAWSESYPSMEYRHGPVSVSGVSTVLWSLGELGPQLRVDVLASGAAVVESDRDPMVELILVQRAAVALALSRGLDPDAPVGLTRSVILT
jgi:fructoselysine-6-P-deglycase FrlB-like protein